MQERNVLILVVVLVVATAGAGVAVNAFRSGESTWRAFDLSLDWGGTPAVGADLQITVTVKQAFLDSRSLPIVFLSVDVGTLVIQASTPATNPWGYATIWNLTGLDLTVPHLYQVTAAPTQAGLANLYAMIWVPLGDLRAVSVDASGHVNPADVSLLATESAAFTVTASA